MINTRCYTVYTLPTRVGETVNPASTIATSSRISDNNSSNNNSGNTIQIVLLTLTMLCLLCLSLVVFWQHRRLRAIGAPTAAFFKMEPCRTDSSDNNNLI